MLSFSPYLAVEYRSQSAGPCQVCEKWTLTPEPCSAKILACSAAKIPCSFQVSLADEQVRCRILELFNALLTAALPKIPANFPASRDFGDRFVLDWVHSQP